MPRAANPFLALTLAMGLCGSATPAATLVVCVAGDRHVAVESMAALCCTGPAGHSTPSLAEGAGCGNCRDYSLIATGETHPSPTLFARADAGALCESCSFAAIAVDSPDPLVVPSPVPLLPLRC